MAEKKTLAQLEEMAVGEASLTLSKLFDEDTFVEIARFVSAQGEQTSVVGGYGRIDSQQAFAFIQDVSVKSGAVCKKAALKIKKIYELAAKNGCPVVAIYDSKGGDIAEGVELLEAYGDIAAASASVSGVVPQIAVVTGVCGGTASTLACMADIVIMTQKAELFMTAPFNAQDKVDGAGTAKNAALSGVAALVASDTAEAIKKARQLVSVLPCNNLEVGGNDYFAVTDKIPSADMKGGAMVEAVADKDSVIELYADFGKASYVAIASVNWKTVGFVCTNKTSDKLTKGDAAKIARFVTMCDAFSIPVVTFVDSEGFEASSVAELSGSVRDCAKLTQSYASATTVKLSVITGNAIGGIFTAMCAKNADFTLAFENAVIAPTTPKAAAIFLYADKLTGENANAQLEKATKDYMDNDACAYTAAGLGLVDRIIAPEQTAGVIDESLEMLSGKRVCAPARKHINFVF